MIDEQNPIDDEIESFGTGDDPVDQRVAELEKQLEEARAQSLYAAAEAQNVRRRLEADKIQASTYAVTGFARDMLSVRDHLDRAIQHLPEGAHDGELKGFVEGIEATLRELDSIFARNGIERVVSKGLPLDPNKHQAMVEIPSADAEPGTVIEEMQAGYTLKDRLLRPALVAVAKGG